MYEHLEFVLFQHVIVDRHNFLQTGGSRIPYTSKAKTSRSCSKSVVQIIQYHADG